MSAIGANGFIRKPIDFEELLEKVEEFCYASSLRKPSEPVVPARGIVA